MLSQMLYGLIGIVVTGSLIFNRKKKWFYLNNKNKWIHFSVPTNEKILEDAFIKGNSQVTYAYPLNSDVKFTAYFKSTRENWPYWNEDKQTGDFTRLKRC